MDERNKGIKKYEREREGDMTVASSAVSACVCACVIWICGGRGMSRWLRVCEGAGGCWERGRMREVCVCVCVCVGVCVCVCV